MTHDPHIPSMRQYLLGLQERIVTALGDADGKPFRTDAWQRPATSALRGDGRSCVIEPGNVFERGGVNFSHVQGDALPASGTASRPNLAGRAFEALGVSLVLHPTNPYCPAVHMNVRMFNATQDGKKPVFWFRESPPTSPPARRRRRAPRG